jgi:peptidoglycan/LPS O-acetylase OafA/YrhL
MVAALFGKTLMRESNRESVQVGATKIPRPAGGLQMKSLPSEVRINWMDPMRGLAALLVCAAHTYYALVAPVTGLEVPVARVLNGLAYQSVFIFFAISGLAITQSILRGIACKGRFEVREYLAARLGRLYPPLLAAVLLGAAVYFFIQTFELSGKVTFSLPGDHYVLRNKAAWTPKEVWAPLTFLSTVFVPGGTSMNGSLWSLNFEFWLYVFAGLCAAFFSNGSRVSGALLLCLLACYFFQHPPSSFYFWYAPVWIFGAFMAGVRVFPSVRWVKAICRAVVFLAAATMLWFVWRFRFACLLPSNTKLGASLVHACAAVLCIAGLDRIWHGSFRQVGKFLSWSAGYSYTLYVIHFPLLLLAMALIRPALSQQPFWAVCGCATAVFVGINGTAWLLSRFLERPGLLRDRLLVILRCGMR